MQPRRIAYSNKNSQTYFEDQEEKNDVTRRGTGTMNLHTLELKTLSPPKIFFEKVHYGSLPPNDERKRRRRRQIWTRDTSTVDDSKSGSSYIIPGMHYVEMYVGNPAQRVTFAVSTNSDHTIFPCTSDCPGQVCGAGNHIEFERSKSNSFQQISCNDCEMWLENNMRENGSADWRCEPKLMTKDFDYSNEEKCDLEGTLITSNNKWVGYGARDYIHTGTFGNVRKPIVGTDRAVKEGFPLQFACQTESSGFVETITSQTANGLLGLSTSKTSFIRQMYNSGKLSSTFFSLCFHRQPPYNTTETTTSAGTLIFGGYDDEYHTTPMNYVKNTQQDNQHYTMTITNIYLRSGGGESVMSSTNNENDEGNIIKLDYNKTIMQEQSYAHLDSASPYTLLDEITRESFQSAWRSMTTFTFTYQPMDITEEEMLSLPTILIQFLTSFSRNYSVDPDETPGMVGNKLDPESPYDVLLAIPPQHYTEYIEQENKYRIRLSLRNKGSSVIGANALQGRHLNFDLISPRIGIAETKQCAVEKKRQPLPPSTLLTTKPSPPTAVPTQSPTPLDNKVYLNNITSNVTNWTLFVPSLTPSELSGATRADLATKFSNNSFPYEYLYFMGLGFIGFTLLIIIVTSTLCVRSEYDEDDKYDHREKQSLVPSRTLHRNKHNKYNQSFRDRARQTFRRKPSYSRRRGTNNSGQSYHSDHE